MPLRIDTTTVIITKPYNFIPLNFSIIMKDGTPRPPLFITPCKGTFLCLYPTLEILLIYTGYTYQQSSPKL